MFQLNIDHYKLSDSKAKYNLLKGLEDYFKSELNIIPRLGAELEFYLTGIDDITLLANKINHPIKQEKGNNQYEVNLDPSQDIAQYAKRIRIIRQKIIDSAILLGGSADFSSKPFADDYGNSMHIHLNFIGRDDIEKYAQILCYYLPETLGYFLPKSEDYNRLDHRFMAPTHVSYGGNNRTVAIRIPDSIPKRLEHRVASASADPALVIYAILQSIKNGLEHPELIPPLEKTHGNAWEEQYGLKKLIETRTN